MFLVIVLGLGAVATLVMGRLNQHTADLTSEIVPGISWSLEIDSVLSEFRSYQYQHVTNENRDEMRRIEEEMAPRQERLEELFNLYSSNLKSERDQELFEFVYTRWLSFMGRNPELIRFSRELDSVAAFGRLRSGEREYIDIKYGLKNLVEYNLNLAEEARISASTSYNRTMLIMVAIVLVSVVIGLLTQIVIIRGIIKPINIMQNKLNQLVEKGGDLKQTIDIKSKDEIGGLAATVNDFIANLRVIVKDISTVAQHLAVSSEQLRTTSQMSTVAANEVARAIGEIASGSNEQARETEQGVISINQLGELVDENYSYCVQLNNSTLNVDSLKNEGLEIVSELVKKSDQSNKASKEVHDIILTTNKSAEKIKKRA